jgi:GDP-L-fucose synthase
MADACVYIMEHIDFQNIKGDLKELRNTHINIGTGEEISIKELSNVIARTIGYNGNIFFDASKPDGTMRKLTDVSKLHSLGWHHKIEIDEGIRKVYDWYIH